MSTGLGNTHMLIAEQQPPPPIDGARFGSGSLLLDGPLDQQVRSLAASMTRRVQTKARHIPSGVLSQGAPGLRGSSNLPAVYQFERYVEASLHFAKNSIFL